MTNATNATNAKATNAKAKATNAKAKAPNAKAKATNAKAATAATDAQKFAGIAAVGTEAAKADHAAEKQTALILDHLLATGQYADKGGRDAFKAAYLSEYLGADLWNAIKGTPATPKTGEGWPKVAIDARERASNWLRRAREKAGMAATRQRTGNKPETGKAETGKAETGKAETGKAETGKAETGKTAPTRGDLDHGAPDTSKAGRARALDTLAAAIVAKGGDGVVDAYAALEDVAAFLGHKLDK